jgi:drug/metabolite transporter (DMT)-like permease
MSIALPASRGGLADMMPAIVAALSYSATDIMMKFVFNDGMDVLTLVSLRGVLVTIFFWVWLRASPPVRWHTGRERWIALGIGALFAILMLTLLEAVALLPVSLAILAYFVYPLLTGLAGSITGVERLGWRAQVAALAAFGGLALILGVNLGGLSVAGLACAFIGALARVVSLLVTRAYLGGTDARVTTWYSMAPSAVLFLALAGVYADWHMPHGVTGWSAFAGVSFCSTLSTLLIYYSTNRVGPFRTALAMNLEPLCTALASVAILGEVFTPLQTAGAAIMIVALVAFQMGRR